MTASAVGKMRAEVSRAYLAGLIDGDGAISATIEKHSEKKFGFRVRVEIKLTQKDDRLLRSLSREFKAGRVSCNRKNDSTYMTHDWIIRDKKDCIRILGYILPFTRLKKRQTTLAIKILQSVVVTRQDLIKNALLADTLARFNVRSKNRRKNFVSMIQACISSND